MESASTRYLDPNAPINFRMWWGLTFAAAAMGLIFLFAPYSADIQFPEDQGVFWYLWQRQDATIWTRLSAWIPFVLHNASLWFLIYQAQQAKSRYVKGLHWFNVWALGINAFFILLHIVQTKVFYDGLAQDVHEATSMMSVVIMVFMIYIMENKRRGVFFGKQVPIRSFNELGRTLRKYHGYYFSWAIVYTFWYHPIEMTAGHLAGFAYTFLLLLQSSLFFTRFHTNRVWTMLLETLFLVHGAFVAAFVMNPDDHAFWSMFLFGGMAVFLITHLHGLGLSARGKLVVATPFVLSIVSFYSFFPQFLAGLGRMPATMYFGTALLFIIIWLVIRFGALLNSAFGAVAMGSSKSQETA